MVENKKIWEEGMEAGWVGGQEKKDRPTPGIGNLRTEDDYFSGINGSWANTDSEFTPFAQRHEPGEQR